MNELDYSELISKYSGHWVLIEKNKVIFSDKSFEIVFKKVKELQLEKENCSIEFIDTGDAVFYALSVSDKEY